MSLHNKLHSQSLLSALTHHVGRSNGINGKDLVAVILGGESDAVAERHLRELIQQLREEGHAICGTPHTGYFIAVNDDELHETCRFLFDRAMTTLKQVAAMKKKSLPDIAGQLGLNI